MDWFDEFTTLHGLPRPDREPIIPCPEPARSVDGTAERVRRHRLYGVAFPAIFRMLTNPDIAACVRDRAAPRYAIETPGIYHHARCTIAVGLPFRWHCTFGGALSGGPYGASALTVTGYEIECPSIFAVPHREAFACPFTPTARGDQLKLDFPEKFWIVPP